jgi:phenylalanine-4-hydroxylase
MDGLRGAIEATAADGTVPQRHAAIPPRDHETWRELVRRQRPLWQRHAARPWREGLARLDCEGGIPDFAATSQRLRAMTGWSLVGVPGLIEEGLFFDHLAARRFPVTVWIRRPEEMDYLEEPDIFHDFAGHVPALTEPAFAGFLQAYGALGAHARRIGALKPLARLYWHMVEFGLIEEVGGGLRAYGAGILSSATETVYSVTSPLPRRLRFEPRRVLRSDYRIDDLQPTYFAIRDFSELFATVAALPDLLAWARDAEPIPPGASDPADQPI